MFNTTNRKKDKNCVWRNWIVEEILLLKFEEHEFCHDTSWDEENAIDRRKKKIVG